MTTKAKTPAKGVASDLTDEEAYLYAILQDHSGLDLAEFCWFDGSTDDGCFRAWPFQWNWWRTRAPKQIDQCVAGGQLVMTEQGHVAIEDITVGTNVLTHQGRWRCVTAVFDQGARAVVSVKGQGHPGLVVTPDHLILARRARRASKPRDGHKGKKLLEPEWRAPQDWEWNDGSSRMHANWGTPARIEATELPPPMEPAYRSGQQNLVTDTWTETWMWLYGLYIAEGSSYIDGPGKGLVHRVRWSVHPDEVADVTAHLDKVGLNWSTAPSGTAINVSVNSRPVTEWLSRWAGRLAPNKHLAPWVFGLPEHLRRAVFDGMVFGDAHWRNDTWSYTTVSKALAVEIRLLGLSLGESVSLHKPKHHPTQTIQGRTVHCHQKYVVDFNPLRNQSKPHMQIVDGTAWAPVTGVTEAGVERVFDLEVEEDHSFIVEGIAVHNCARAVGKSLSIKARMFAFPFRHPNQEAVITAPELIHLEPIINLIEDQFYSTRLGREMLQKGRSAVTHRPFMMNFRNSARLMGRIPQKDGKGVKGIHPLQLELDEAQDYPKRGWTELNATLKSGFDDSEWRAHGVTRGVRDKFYEYTQDKPGNSWTVHRMTAMHRPNWSDQEREDAIQLYGGHRDDPDYRRNILGKHGDATNPLFVVTRLYTCVDDDESSAYNLHEYVHLEISDLMVEDLGPDGDVTDLLLFPDSHRQYEVTWCGMDVGYTHDPSEILVWGEYHLDADERKAMAERKKASPKAGLSRFKLLARISLKRVPNLKQVRIILGIIAFYKPKAFGLDKTGVGLPLFQDLLAIIREEGDFSAQAQAAADIIKGYNFAAKVIVDIDDTVEVDEVDGDQVRDAGIHRNVLEQSTDALRGYVDTERLWLPWDDQLLAEFEGQTFSYSKSAIDQFGRARRVFSEGRFHALDASRMFAMAHSQQAIEAIVGAKNENEAVIARFFQPGL